MNDINWNIKRKGRVWTEKEAWPRCEMIPEKTEMIDGKLLWSDEDRLVMLGLLLENVGMDEAVRLGDPKLWQEAINSLDNETI